MAKGDVTVRVIFRGLIAFLWKGGKMTAVMVDGEQAPKHSRDHSHVARVSWVGHKAVYGNDTPSAVVARRFYGKMRFRIIGGSVIGSTVTKGGDFDTHVPSFKTLLGGNPKLRTDIGFFDWTREKFPSPVDALVQCEAGKICPTGMVDFWRAPDRVYTPYGESTLATTQEAKFIGGVSRRDWELATECELVMHLNSTYPKNPAKVVVETLSSKGKKDHVTLRSRFGGKGNPEKGHPARHDVIGRDIEILITNFSRRLEEPLPYSSHYQWFFDLLDDPSKYAKDLTVPMEKVADKYQTEWEGNSKKGDNWGKVLREDCEHVLHRDAVYPNVPCYPFPYIAEPEDTNSRLIKDWDDREICPQLGFP